MIQVMDKDNERNANLAPKILNDTIKACGNTTNASGGTRDRAFMGTRGITRSITNPDLGPGAYAGLPLPRFAH
jgi:hypothetical protein